MNCTINSASHFSGLQAGMSPISLVQLAGSVRKFNLNRPFILPILRDLRRWGGWARKLLYLPLVQTLRTATTGYGLGGLPRLAVQSPPELGDLALCHIICPLHRYHCELLQEIPVAKKPRSDYLIIAIRPSTQCC